MTGKYNNTGAFTVVTETGHTRLSHRQPRNRQFAIQALSAISLFILSQNPALAQSQGNKDAASRATNRPKIQARLTDDENLRQRLNRPYDRTDERIMRAPKPPPESALTISGKVSGKIYVFETSESFAPDFLAAGASLGVKGNQGPWGGTLEVSLAEKANRVGVTKGYASFASQNQTEVRLGRGDIAGIDSYLADLNIGPFGLGIADGLFLLQGLEPSQNTKLAAGAGVANSFDQDAAFDFKTRSNGGNRGFFGWLSAELWAIKFQILGGIQKEQSRTLDDPETKEFNEERLADFSQAESSLGINFENFSLGIFASKRFLGEESYTIIDQSLPASPAPTPLAQATETITAGTGFTLKNKVNWFVPESESVFATFGYSEQQMESKAIKNIERSVGVSTGYKTDQFSLTLSYAHLLSDDSIYKDRTSEATYDSLDRIELATAFKFSK
jgi:hypothetical protein